MQRSTKRCVPSPRGPSAHGSCSTSNRRVRCRSGWRRGGWATPPTDHNGIRVELVGLASDPVERRAQGVYFGDGLELVASEYDSGPHVPG